MRRRRLASSRPRVLSLLVAVLAIAALASCSTGSSSHASSSASASVPPPPAIVANDLASNSAHHVIPVPGEGFDLSVDYWSSTDIAHWQSAGAKALNLSLHLALHPDAPAQDVLLYDLTVAVTVKATTGTFEGLQIVSASDTASGVPGFLVSDIYPYDSVVNVPAMAQPLVDRWKSVAGDKPISSAGLRGYGVYANEIGYTYNILVKNQGDSEYHKRVVTDVLTVPSDSA
jgi:hypothetical protein